MSIVENRKAFHDYFIEERVEAGIALEGWEVKSIRAGRANLKEAYVVVKNGEIMLVGAHIAPLAQASTHVHADPTRTRRLLMHKDEIARYVGRVERAGYTMVPIDLTTSAGRSSSRSASPRARSSTTSATRSASASGAASSSGCSASARPRARSAWSGRAPTTSR
jgi:SsrA-binding protein